MEISNQRETTQKATLTIQQIYVYIYVYIYIYILQFNCCSICTFYILHDI